MPGALDALVNAWRTQQFAPGARNVLAGDEATINAPAEVAHHASWNSLIKSDQFGAPDGSAFHLGLLPMPFLGNLKRARVFLLSLNPGVGPHDYFAEHQVSDYRKALEANLQQTRDVRFPFLDPAHSWHGGSAYWAPRLRGITEGVRRRRNLQYREAIDICAQNIAVLELVPYHSATFNMPQRRIDALASVKLMREFVFRELLPRHRQGDCKMLVLRSRNKWLQSDYDGADLPQPTMPRSAYISNRDAEKAAETICRFA